MKLNFKRRSEIFNSAPSDFNQLRDEIFSARKQLKKLFKPQIINNIQNNNLIFNKEEYQMVYHDSEEDSLIISEDEDLLEAIDYSQKRGKQYLVVDLIDLSTGELVMLDEDNLSESQIYSQISKVNEDSYYHQQDNSNYAPVQEQQQIHKIEETSLENSQQILNQSTLNNTILQQKHQLLPQQLEQELRKQIRAQIQNKLKQEYMNQTNAINESTVISQFQSQNLIQSTNTNDNLILTELKNEIKLLEDKEQKQIIVKQEIVEPQMEKIIIKHGQNAKQSSPEINQDQKLKFSQEMFSVKKAQPIMIQINSKQSLQLKWIIINKSDQQWAATPELKNIQDQETFHYQNISDKLLQPGEEIELVYELQPEDLQKQEEQFINLQLYFTNPQKKGKEVSKAFIVVLDKGTTQ
ncbi:UNKNOWN [Stylonychia lemnae]|uniref:PB1 domain-containing protein n=1 Tax=Stylonychia lemnae TaxID=5949 RepID=A0A078B6R6_STYLE|nr:UNKNOWN [Stylonychia lemnae]|eukprot:CDW89876.1 UNKNOWN [Stylonychia lemnae]